jgi:hypothetical protein
MYVYAEQPGAFSAEASIESMASVIAGPWRSVLGA